MNKEYILGEIKAENIPLNLAETALRLNASKEYAASVIKECKAELIKHIDCKYSAIRTDISFIKENTLNLGFGEIVSRDLYKNLKDCKEAYVIALTLGISVDRFLNRLTVSSVSKHFICDGLASAFAESALEIAEKEILKGAHNKPRFSVGYGDLDLALQPQVLEAVNAFKTLNITISKNLLMSPSKSITAIIGIA